MVRNSCGPKLCRGGSHGHTLPDRALTGPTDVTDCATTIANRGRTVAAGVVPGVRQGQADDSKAVVWESAASRSPRERSGSTARQWCAVGVLTGGAGDVRRRKRRRVISILKRVVGAAGSLRLPAGRFLGRTMLRSKEVSRGRESSFDGGMTANTGGVSRIRRRFLLRYAYVLGGG
jgi:hypothetical protein